MPVVEDFTILASGAEVAGEGRVEKCPSCGRNGVRERVNGQSFFLHSSTTELMSDGLLETPGECCPTDED
jgi:hypothetical protein